MTEKKKSDGKNFWYYVRYVMMDPNYDQDGKFLGFVPINDYCGFCMQLEDYEKGKTVNPPIGHLKKKLMEYRKKLVMIDYVTEIDESEYKALCELRESTDELIESCSKPRKTKPDMML
jgi:hypothetical protein